MQIDTIDPTREPLWERFLMRHPQATIFHAPAWARVIGETYGFRPRYLVAREGEEIIAGIPLFQVNGSRLIGLPFSDLCLPLLDADATGRALLEAAKRAASSDGVHALELRGGALDLEAHGFARATAYLHHEIPLDAPVETLIGRFRANTRGHVRQAERAGLTVRVTRAPEDMERFYALNVATRKKHGLIPQPRRFFRNIQRHVIDEDAGFLMLCEHEGRAIAADVQLVFKDTLTGKYNASDARYLHLRPNHLLMQRTVKLGAALGYRSIDLGRCELENEGLRRFKLGWGATETPLSYYCYPAAGAASAAERTRGARRLLGLFVRFAPDWALRQAGALLYRYAA
jgi:CelD/BcsL family acetyltransferase involved in cellulose biosynthesis